MRQFVKRGKQFICFLIFVFCLMCAVLCMQERAEAASPAGQSGALEMNVSYGFNDTAKGDRYVKVTVLLNHQDDTDFSGTFKILTTESSLEVYRYEYPLVLKGQGKTEKVCYIPLGVKTDQMYVSVCEESGRELIRKRLKLSISRDVSECFVGVFSDEPESLAYLDGVGMHYGSVKTTMISLDQGNAPEDVLGYDQLDLVVISDYDLNQLSQVQQDALYLWVDRGGTLLLGGGRRYREAMGFFAGEILEPPYTEPQKTEVNMGMEYAQNAPQDSVLPLVCADINLKNGRTLIPGEGFPLLSFTRLKRGRIVAAAFSLGEIGDFCENRPAFLEKFLTKTLGETKINELSQMEYYGFSSLYFAIQGLVNTGDAGRLPNVALYTVVIIIYLLLIGPALYFCLKKRKIHCYYMAAVAACAVLFTGIIYVMGIGTRFRAPFVTYATILDTTGEQVEEETYVNIRSPYNKPYTVKLRPEYTVRPVTKSYFYESVTAPRFTGEENYKTSIGMLPDRTEIRVRDTVAFTPKLFTLSRQLERNGQMEIGGEMRMFGGTISGTVVNHFEEPLEDAALILYGKAILLGDIAPGQEVSLSEYPVFNYPLSHTYALAQMITGADQYEKTDVSDEEYMVSQERSRLLSFYMDANLNTYFSGARLVAFASTGKEGAFMAEDGHDTEGLRMITSELPLDQEKNGLVCRQALEQEPNVISGNYYAEYNTMYTGEPAEPVTVEYSLGSDLKIRRLCFETVSPEFFDPEYPYLVPFSGEMYFYNYDTGRNDRVELKESFTAIELEPYLSPSNTLTVKYVSESNGEYGWESCLPMIYAVGEEK